MIRRIDTAAAPLSVALVLVLTLTHLGTAADQPSLTAQRGSNLEELRTAPFVSLQSQRDSMNTQIAELDTIIDDLTTLQSALETQERLAPEIEAATDEERKEELQQEFRRASERATLFRVSGITSANQVPAALNERQAELKGLKALKDSIEAEMNRRVDLEGPKQTFKTQISLGFSVLVGLVIVGFFYMAGRDEALRREIFAGQAGIQFVTLFSLIIAIILFGITEILEGKELSALLGGLSGYILGRSTSPKAPT